MNTARLCLLLLVVAFLAGCTQPEMKTSTSSATNAKVTVVHLGAPW